MDCDTGAEGGCCGAVVVVEVDAEGKELEDELLDEEELDEDNDEDELEEEELRDAVVEEVWLASSVVTDNISKSEVKTLMVGNYAERECVVIGMNEDDDEVGLCKAGGDVVRLSELDGARADGADNVA